MFVYLLNCISPRDPALVYSNLPMLLECMCVWSSPLLPLLPLEEARYYRVPSWSPTLPTVVSWEWIFPVQFHIGILRNLSPWEIGSLAVPVPCQSIINQVRLHYNLSEAGASYLIGLHKSPSDRFISTTTTTACRWRSQPIETTLRRQRSSMVLITAARLTDRNTMG